MVSIARKNLIEDVPRFLVAQAGIMFAVTLVTIQTGVLNGFLRSTVLLIENSEADLWVASEKLVQFEVTEPLVASQVESVRAVSGVEIAEPLILGSRRWYFDSGKSDPLRIVGFEPNGRLFNPGVVTAGDSARLSDPFTAMIDQSRQEGLKVNGLGHLGRIDTLPVEIIGFTEDSQSIVSSPFLFTSLANANAYISSGYKAELNCKVGSSQALECTRTFELAPTLEETQNLAPPNPLTSTDGITYILVKAAPQENLKTLAKRIESEIDGVRVLSQQELAGLNQN
ncbi:MAG: ABC transporter permease, partial [Cyanobacteria bacterium P01_H01_bin.15]